MGTTGRMHHSWHQWRMPAKTAEISGHNSLKPSESHACSILTMINRLRSLTTMYNKKNVLFAYQIHINKPPRRIVNSEYYVQKLFSRIISDVHVAIIRSIDLDLLKFDMVFSRRVALISLFLVAVGTYRRCFFQ